VTQSCHRLSVWNIWQPANYVLLHFNDTINKLSNNEPRPIKMIIHICRGKNTPIIICTAPSSSTDVHGTKYLSLCVYGTTHHLTNRTSSIITANWGISVLPVECLTQAMFLSDWWEQLFRFLLHKNYISKMAKKMKHTFRKYGHTTNLEVDSDLHMVIVQNYQNDTRWSGILGETWSMKISICSHHSRKPNMT
jgi:hypothetical protein